MRWPRAFAQLTAAGLEDVAARLSERAKAYPNRQLYKGYEQGVIDGLNRAEHARKWLAERGKR